MDRSCLSGREDSNLRPQRPERCALTGLRHSPQRAEHTMTSARPAMSLDVPALAFSRVDSRHTPAPYALANNPR